MKSEILKMSKHDAIENWAKLLYAANAANPHEIERLRSALHRDMAFGEREQLQRVWYSTLRATGKPNYQVYDNPVYLADTFDCWHVYSSKYLKAIQNPGSLPPAGVYTDLGNPRIIVDVGNGLGFSSAALTQMFPHAAVYATNLPGTSQYRVASLLAEQYGFRMVPDTSHIGKHADLVFASEYFEHFPNPVRHLQEIHAAIRPRKWLIANTFGGDSIGHFDAYQSGSKSVPGRLMGREFGKAMRTLGYRNVKTAMWNNRPAYWTRNDQG